MKVSKPLKIGAAAQRLGVSASMLRSLEELGLSTPPRSQGKYRLYSSNDLRILRSTIYFSRTQGLNAPAIMKQQQDLNGLRAAAPKSDQSFIGLGLRKLRLKRGISLTTVAKAVNVSKGFLCNLERSRSGASNSVKHKLAEYYGVDIANLLSPIDDTQPLVRRKGSQVLGGWPRYSHGSAGIRKNHHGATSTSRCSRSWSRKIIRARRRAVSLSAARPPDHHLSREGIPPSSGRQLLF
jgi:DNA-binding transcriptional MerR regulator